MLKFIAQNNEKRRNQGQIEETCCISDDADCKFLRLTIVAKRSILNVVEILNSSLKTSPCTKTSSILCEKQSFLLFRNVATFIEINFVLLFYFLQYDEVLLSSLLDDCYQYIVFIDRSSQWLFKVKIACKRASFIKK